MSRNGIGGFVLVFLVLALFIELRLAFWVSLGIPISFLGAVMLMPGLDVTLNTVSLFGFIIVLGIVVDDAIIVGENVYSHQERDGDGLGGAIRGAQEIATPVVFAVLTTVAAFMPLLFVPGFNGKFLRVIPLVVIPCLLFSLVEALNILPAHLAHIPGRRRRGSNMACAAGLRRGTSLRHSSRIRAIRGVHTPVAIPHGGDGGLDPDSDHWDGARWLGCLPIPAGHRDRLHGRLESPCPREHPRLARSPQSGS